MGLRICIYKTPQRVRSIYDFKQKVLKKNGVTIKLRNGELVGNCFVRGNYIFHLVVNPKYRKNGYGALLIKTAEKVIKQNGYDRAMLIPADNSPSLRKYYSSLGFIGFTGKEKDYEEEDMEFWRMWKIF